ncbi:DNA polymerase III subunit delta [bacterium]|nr:DNA polymerase III subunit delta [bacterium]
MKFSEIHGHEELKKKLVKHISSHKIPHAQLFLGPEGCGSLALAIAYIQYLFCHNPGAEDSCGECSSCIKISKHSHPDVHYSYPTAGAKQISTNYIEDWRSMLNSNVYMNTSDWMTKISKDENKTPNITREETRDILAKLSLKPFEGKAKALIIWMPEYLDKVGNSLLKIIEEPPQKTYFILVSEKFDKLLSTITSRTQLVKINAYSDEEVKAYLSSKYQLDHSMAEHIAFVAEGNLREARMLVEEVDDNHSEIFRSFMLASYGNDLDSISKIVDDLAKTGRTQIQLFLQNGLKNLRETLLFKNLDDYQIRFSDDYKGFIKNFSKTLNARMIEKDYELINETIYHIGRNANAKISLFHLSLGLRHNFIRKK